MPGTAMRRRWRPCWQEGFVSKSERVIKMRKMFFSAAVILFAALLASCGAETDNVQDSPDIPQTDSSANSGELLSQINGHIDSFEYNKAVKLMEDNSQACSGKEFDSARKALDEHFAKSAKDYHTAAMIYITRMIIDGFDYNTGFEGYERESCTLDPEAIVKNLSETLSDDEQLIDKRVTIKCSGTAADMDIKVSIDYCGRTAVYPEE